MAVSPRPLIPPFKLGQKNKKRAIRLTNVEKKTVKIESYDKCDFRPMFDYFQAQKEAKKAVSAAEKKAQKAEKDKLEEPYQFCQWNGRKEKVGNFRVEPPGLFRGRGDHPKRGMLKKRVKPEQITLNLGKDAIVPPPPKGHKWGNIVHNQTASWLAMWTENINGNVKYVMLAVTSSLKGQSDFKKYEKARELKVLHDSGLAHAIVGRKISCTLDDD